MVDFDDWRRALLPLIAREDGSLDHFTFARHAADEYAPGEHTQCELCWAVISNLDHPKYLKEGLRCTETGSWVCPGCFHDFKEEVHWELSQGGPYEKKI